MQRQFFAATFRRLAVFGIFLAAGAFAVSAGAVQNVYYTSNSYIRTAAEVQRGCMGYECDKMQDFNPGPIYLNYYSPGDTVWSSTSGEPMPSVIADPGLAEVQHLSGEARSSAFSKTVIWAVPSLGYGGIGMKVVANATAGIPNRGEMGATGASAWMVSQKVRIQNPDALNTRDIARSCG